MKKKELKEDLEFTIDDEAVAQSTPMSKPVEVTPIRTSRVKQANRDTDGIESCLQNKIVTVKHLPQPGTVSDPKHVLYGGMAERSFVVYTVPKLRSGTYVNVLTDKEKEYLEAVMGLEVGTMNVYNKTDNFWDNSTENGISKVRLTKQDTRLDLNNPVDYIKYKILLANKDFICPDLHTLLEKPKATYKFVLITNNEVSKAAKNKMSTKMQCYVEFGKVESNEDVLRMVIETITSKPLAKNTKLEFLQTKAGELIDADSKLFLTVVTDPLINTKILIKKCVEHGFISKRGDFYYLRSDNTPLCEGGEDPTFVMAAKYLSNPKRQDMKLSLQTLLKD